MLADFRTMLPTRERNSSDWEKSSRTITAGADGTDDLSANDDIGILASADREPHGFSVSAVKKQARMGVQGKVKPTQTRKDTPKKKRKQTKKKDPDKDVAELIKSSSHQVSKKHDLPCV